MAYAWQTVEQAALTLGISTRTIARRIAKTELESRLHSGRREVYIRLPDGYVAPPNSDTSGQDSFSSGNSSAATSSGPSANSFADRKFQTEKSSDQSGSSKKESDTPGSARERVHVVTIDGELTGADAPGYQEEYEQTVRQTVAASREGFDIETSAALILAEDRARRAELSFQRLPR